MRAQGREPNRFDNSSGTIGVTAVRSAHEHRGDRPAGRRVPQHGVVRAQRQAAGVRRPPASASRTSSTSWATGPTPAARALKEGRTRTIGLVIPPASKRLTAHAAGVRGQRGRRRRPRRPRRAAVPLRRRPRAVVRAAGLRPPGRRRDPDGDPARGRPGRAAAAARGCRSSPSATPPATGHVLDRRRLRRRSSAAASAIWPTSATAKSPWSTAPPSWSPPATARGTGPRRASPRRPPSGAWHGVDVCCADDRRSGQACVERAPGRPSRRSPRSSRSTRPPCRASNGPWTTPACTCRATSRSPGSPPGTWAEDFRPPLTAADVPAQEMGAQAVDLLLERIAAPAGAAAAHPARPADLAAVEHRRGSPPRCSAQGSRQTTALLPGLTAGGGNRSGPCSSALTGPGPAGTTGGRALQAPTAAKAKCHQPVRADFPVARSQQHEAIRLTGRTSAPPRRTNGFCQRLRECGLTCYNKALLHDALTTSGLNRMFWPRRSRNRFDSPARSSSPPRADRTRRRTRCRVAPRTAVSRPRSDAACRQRSCGGQVAPAPGPRTDPRHTGG